MAGGTTHRKDTYVVAASAVVGGFVLYLPADVVIATAAGAMAGAILGPDLDQDHKTENEIVLYRIHWLLGFVWQLIWMPYALVMPHRSFFSHFPVVGTVIRIAYLATPVFLLVKPVVEGRLALLLVCAAVGLALSDAAHWLRDKLSKRR